MSYEDTAKAMDDKVWPFTVTEYPEVFAAGWTEPRGAVDPNAAPLDSAGREVVEAMVVADVFYGADDHGAFYYRADHVGDESGDDDAAC